MKHTPKFDITRYPSSSLAQKIAWTCSCGKSGQITDGRLGASLRRARTSFRRHVRNAETSSK